MAGVLTAARTGAARGQQNLEPRPLLKALSVGETVWGQDDYFQIRFKRDVEGRLIGLDAGTAARGVWVAAQKSTGEVRLSRFSADGKESDVSCVPLTLHKFRLWDEAGKHPLFAGADDFRLWGFSPGGKPVELAAPETRAQDFAAVPKEHGGPLVVAAYQYGAAGLRAFRPDGKVSWEMRDLERISTVRLDFAGHRPVLAAADGTGKLTIVGLQGLVLERIQAGGNLDRVLFDQDSQGQWMFGLDSRAGSWKETLTVRRADRGRSPGEREWRETVSLDLGRVTVTAWALGGFGSGPRMLALGTDNGWVLIIDRQGRVVTESRFRGNIVALLARDLDRDRKDELIVGVEGFSGNLFVFGRK